MMPNCVLSANDATEDGVLPFAPICPGEMAEQSRVSEMAIFSSALIVVTPSESFSRSKVNLDYKL